MYLVTRVAGEPPDDEMDNGMPRSPARQTASEKLSTVVIDITVDARQIFMAFNTVERELVFCDGVWGTSTPARGRSENITKTTGDTI